MARAGRAAGVSSGFSRRRQSLFAILRDQRDCAGRAVAIPRGALVEISPLRQIVDDIKDPSKKRNDEPPDEYAFHDPDRCINRTQALKFRFQVILALAALPRIKFAFSPAAWALQSFSHGQPMISPTASSGKPLCPRPRLPLPLNAQ